MSDRLQYLRETFREPLLKAFLADRRNQMADSGIVQHDGMPTVTPMRDVVETNENGFKMTVETAHAVFERYHKAKTVEAADAVFDRYREADPTRRASYLQWVLRLAIDGKLPGEDIPKARETLEAFERFKRRLASDQRDIGVYDTLGAVWTAVEPFVLADAPASNAEADRREREAARAESDILLEENGLIVAIPRTERAACWWGRGTRWCTAATDSANMFDHYSKDGPLVVFVLPDGTKYQGHAPTQQFMDAADEEVEFQSALRDHLPLLEQRLPAVCVAMLWKGMKAFEFGHQIPGNDRSEIQRVAEREIFGLIHSEIQRFGSEDAVSAAVTEYGAKLRYMPHALITRDTAMAALRKTVSNAKDVPADLWTREMAEMAVGQDGSALAGVPDAMHDEALLILAAVTSKIPRAAAVQNARADLLTPELRATLVEGNPYCLLGFPDEHKTLAMCLMAVQEEALTFQYVPEAMQTKEMCLAAVRQNSQALKFVRRDLVDEEIVLETLKGAGCLTGDAVIVWERTPKHLRTPTVCIEVSCRWPQAVKESPVEMWNDDTLRTLAKRNFPAFIFLPREVKEKVPKDIYLDMVRNSPNNLIHVPVGYKSFDICLAAATSLWNDRGQIEPVRHLLSQCVAPEYHERILEVVTAPARTPVDLASSAPGP